MTTSAEPQTTLAQDELDAIHNGDPGLMGISEQEYLDHYAAQFYEWVGGHVVKMSPVSMRHAFLSGYLYILLTAYLSLRPIGTVLQAPFLMQLREIDIKREPDLMVVLKTNPSLLTATMLDGPADLCIEIVSPESGARDHGNKLLEYEKGAVMEYWIIDPIRTEARFYRLEEGVYKRQDADADGDYRTPTLPGLVLHVPTLWLSDLPNTVATVEAVRAMLGES